MSYIPDISCAVYDENNRELFRAGNPGWAYMLLIEKGLLTGANIDRQYTLVGDDYKLTVNKNTSMAELNKYSLARAWAWSY